MTDLTIKESLEKLRAKEISATELTKAYIERIKKFGGRLNCYITQTPERALADAKESDRRYAEGAARPLEGIPIGMKDLFAVKGIRMTAASKMLEDFIPPYESAISQRLQDAGTVLLGKTNLDEFAMGTFSITSHFGAPVSPYKTERRLTAGGSSGGSASAVAAGLAAAATGTDTGGSIRFPSAMTGLVGLKPTYGVCSRYGCIAFASSLDHPGPMARTVDDCELLFRAMMGHDPREATSSPQMPSEQIRAARCIGVVQEFESVEIAPDMKRLRDLRLRELADRGAKIVVVSIPNILDALAAYYVIAPAEASSNLARYDGVRFGRRAKASAMGDMYELSRAEGFGTEVQRRMIIGSAVLSSQSYEVYFLQAARVRRMIADAFARAFEKCDFIICPASSGPAIPLNSDLSPMEYYALDLFTVAMNLSGIPACSVPCGRTGDGLPLGLQVLGRRFDDFSVLHFAREIEKLAALDNRPTRIMGE